MKAPGLILPANLRLKAKSYHYQHGSILIDAFSCQSGSKCPLCNKKSDRVHSRYERSLADLPISGSTVKVKLLSRKYFCDNTDCPRIIFTERFIQGILPYGRRLTRAIALISKMALELGGNKGANISRFAGVPASPSTIIRILKKLDTEEHFTTSGIIGIDDYAFKKGRSYGTIIVDLQTRQVIDLLPDREAGTLAKWMNEHTEVQVVSRDRYGPYALGAANGAPQALQVADRFHLIKNLGEATNRMFQTKGKILKEVYDQYHNITTLSPETEQTKKTPTVLNTNEQGDLLNPAKVYNFNQVKALQLSGMSCRAIARSLKICRKTITKYMNIDSLYLRKGYSSTNFDSFTSMLLDQNNRGKPYKALYQIIRDVGFTGAYSNFCKRMNGLYEANNINKKGVAPKVAPTRTWSANKLSYLLYLDHDDLNMEDKRIMELLLDKCPEIRQVETLVKQFKNLFKKKEPESLNRWIMEAQGVSPLKNFAKNLLRDYDAVNNAVVTEYSNGQVEGQVNRLKTIKRMMYGRAGFDLLREMVLSKSILDHQN